MGILLAGACLLASPARALADDDALYKCHRPPADAKLTVQFQPDVTLGDLAVWVTGFTCKRVVFDAEAARRATKLALIAPSAMTPAQATRLFVDLVQKTGLVVAERPDAFVIRLGPSMPRACPDVGPAAPRTAPPAPAPVPVPPACHKPAADAKLAISRKPDSSLAELALWVTGLTCKRVDFDAGIPRGATTVTAIVPAQVTPKQAVQVFVDAVDAAGLTIVEKADAFAVGLGPRSPRGCVDRVAAATPSGPATSPGTPVVPPASDPDDALDAAMDAGIRKIDDTHYEVKRAFVDQIFQNPMGIAKSARIVPSMKNGQTEGIKIYAVRPRSLFARLGMANGDTIKAINGHPLTSSDKALEVYTALRGATRIDIQLVRRGADLTITITVVK